MADGAYRFQPGAGQYYYPQHNQHPRHLQQRNGSPVNTGRTAYGNEVPSPSRSPGPQSPAHNSFNMYAQSHQSGQHLMTNGAPNHQRYAMQMNMARYQHSGHQHQGHQQHQSQTDHVAHGGQGNNYAAHQHNMSMGGLPTSNPQYGQSHLQNGTPNSSHSTLNNPPNEHWRHQLALWQQSREATTPHFHARTSPHVKQGVVAVATNGRREPEKEERNRVSSDPEATSHTWMALDFGGLGLKAISTALFDYDFLDKLYFNNNKLSYIPSAIGRLRNLTHLDLSQNNLQELPSEMGMLINLKTLLLFDNHLETLPDEMGALYVLETLGIEGNTLNEELMGILKSEGTRALISHLREHAADPEPPTQRDWIDLDDPIVDSSASSLAKFSVLSYNILCDKYATYPHYGYVSQTALSWEHRKDIILAEIRSHDADIVCLQEAESQSFNEFLRPELAHNDYKGFFWPKTRARTMAEKEAKLVDGCAIFFKNSRYVLLDKKLIDFANTAINRPDMKSAHDIFNRVMPRDDIAVVAFLEERMTGLRLIVVNAHVFWNPAFKDVKVVQVAILMEQITKLAEQYTKWPPCADKELYRYANGDDEQDGEPAQEHQEPAPSAEYSSGALIPLIMAGDFNSTPESGVYELLAHGALAHSHSDLATRNYGEFTRSGMNHPFSLKSSYSHIGELSFTNYVPDFTGVLDYIWYSHNTLSVTGLLGDVDKEYLTRVPGFPNWHFPSDHLALLAQFAVKSRKEKKAVEVDFGPERERRT